MRKKIILTGASGFIGRPLAQHLARSGADVVALSRNPVAPAPDLPLLQWRQVPGYADVAALRQAFEGVDLVIHLADNPARADHAGGGGGGGGPDPVMSAVLGAMHAAGVPCLLLASSIYARLHEAGQATPYGAHKHRIERQVLDCDAVRSLILRLPPVYGPGCKGGFATLAGLIRRGLPVPVGRATQTRDYLAIDNLTDLVDHLAFAPLDSWTAHDGRLYEPSDNAPIATADLARLMRDVCNSRSPIVPLPLPMLRMLGALTGRTEAVAAILSPLHVRQTPSLAEDFGWTPPRAMPATLDFLAARR